MSRLTFPYSSPGKPIGAKFASGEGLACPANNAYTADDALGVLERVTNNVLLEGFRQYRYPSFPLAGEPIRAAQFEQMSINSRVVQHVFYPGLQHTKFYNPVPSLANYQVTRELIKACGGSIANAQLIANSNSIGCAPPRGERGIAGKDRYYQSAVTGVFELGPFCVTEFLELDNFAATLEQYKTAAINAGGMALEYEKIRKFVEMSRKNASAVAGTLQPVFFSGAYGEFPTSSGSLEWFLRAIDIVIGPELMGGVNDKQPIIVSMSAQLRKFLINQYSRQHGVQIREELGTVEQNVKGYIASFQNSADFSMTSLRTNRTVIFRISNDPVYVQMAATGTNLAEWEFQDFYLTEPGNDTMSGQANGYRQKGNPHYGDATIFCEGEQSVLCEQIMIWTPNAFHYEGFPENPLGTAIAPGVETNLQNLWAGTNIKWSFGVEVQKYWLDPMNTALAAVDFPQLSNIDNTWFAGRLKMGMQFVEDNPLQMMTLMVRVPTDETTLASTQTLIECSRPAPITITAAPPPEAPVFCSPIPTDHTPDEPGAGLAITPVRLSYNLPATGSPTVTVTLQRFGGVTGTLTLPFVTVDDTAIEGAHFTLADGNLVFADGEDTADLDIVLHHVARGDTDPCFVTASITWDNSPVVLVTGSVTSTKLCFKLYEADAGYDPAACAADADCGDCAE